MKYGYCLTHHKDFILYRDDIISKLVKIGIKKNKNILFEYQIIDENMLEIKIIEELDDNEYYKVNISKDIELYVNEFNSIFIFNYKQSIEDFKNFLESINKRIIIYC